MLFNRFGDPMFPDIFDDVSEVPFEDDFDRRASELERPTRRAGTQRVALVDLGEGEWSGPGSSYYGQSQRFAASIDNRQTILKMPQRGQPQRWTLQLGIDYPDSQLQGPAGGFEATAEIKAGSGGAVQTIFVDWIAGQTVPLVGNAFEVSALYSTNITVPADLVLSATLGHGNAARSPTFAIRNPTVVTGPGATGTAVRFPPFARRVSLVTDYQTLAADLSLGGAVAAALDATGIAFGGTVTGPAPGSASYSVRQFMSGGGPIEIPGAFFKYAFFTNDTTHPLRPTWVFELGL